MAFKIIGTTSGVEVDVEAVSKAMNTKLVDTAGNQVFPIAAAIGAQTTPIVKNFNTPLVTNSSRFFHVGLKMPRATATVSQIIRGLVNIGGYFD